MLLSDGAQSHFATPFSALLTVGRELLVAVDVCFVCVFVQCPVLWRLLCRSNEKFCMFAAFVCIPTALIGGTPQQAPMYIPQCLWVSSLMPGSSSREQKQ